MEGRVKGGEGALTTWMEVPRGTGNIVKGGLTDYLYSPPFPLSFPTILLPSLRFPLPILPVTLNFLHFLHILPFVLYFSSSPLSFLPLRFLILSIWSSSSVFPFPYFLPASFSLSHLHLPFLFYFHPFRSVLISLYQSFIHHFMYVYCIFFPPYFVIYFLVIFSSFFTYRNFQSK